MQFNPLSHIEIIGRTNILTNRIIVKALQSNRGDRIRATTDVGLKMMVESVINAVCNKLTVEAQRASEYKYDSPAGFKPRPDVEIEEEVTAFFEIDGKLQYREVKLEAISSLPGFDKTVESLKRPMKRGSRVMQYEPVSVADRLEKADILTNNAIMVAWQCEDGAAIRELSPADFKELWKGVFSLYYQELVAEAEASFKQACKDFVPGRDGIENDPRKKFKPKTEFEIVQALNAYFEEHGTLH